MPSGDALGGHRSVTTTGDVMSGSNDPVERMLARRQFIANAAKGTAVAVLGGTALYVLDDDLTSAARAQTRLDGRPRLPPGQRVLSKLKPMGGTPGSAKLSEYKLRIHGEVDKPFTVDFRSLLKMGPVKTHADVHCVTGWSVLGALWEGVKIKDLAAKAGVRDSARYLIVEAAHGYTANMPLAPAMRDDCLITWRLDGKSLARAHGAPVRALIPDLYFWKSAKWVTGLRFSKTDAPGYWEKRGYHNIADPWKEQRHG